MSNRVMIVDDELSNREVFAVIARTAGCTVCCTAEDGQQALDLFDPENVDVVLIDMHMPDMKGTETVKKMKRKMEAMGCTRKIRFVFIFSPKGCGEMISMLGFYDAILPKPCSAALLAAVLRA